MIDITPKTPGNYNIITGYGPGNFIVNEVKYTSNIILYKNNLWPWQQAIDVSNLDYTMFELIIEHQRQRSTNESAVILFGQVNHTDIPFKLKQMLAVNNLYIETMNTAAACRTYNVLLAEGREIYAVLMMLQNNNVVENKADNRAI